MTTYVHVTAPTQFLEANGVRYAYRRFGPETGTPLVFLQHFRGGLDNWDPLVIDGLAQGRPVILVNYAGVASSGGEPAQTVDGFDPVSRCGAWFAVPVPVAVCATDRLVPGPACRAGVTTSIFHCKFRSRPVHTTGVSPGIRRT